MGGVNSQRHSFVLEELIEQQVDNKEISTATMMMVVMMTMVVMMV